MADEREGFPPEPELPLGIAPSPEPAQPGGVAASEEDFCEHYWAHRVQGGRKFSVRMCELCPAIDWDDLDEQAGAIEATERRDARLRILAAARQAVVTYSRPGLGNGPEHGQHVKVVPWAVLAELLGGEEAMAQAGLSVVSAADLWLAVGALAVAEGQEGPLADLAGRLRAAAGDPR